MSVALNAHSDGRSIVLDEKYPLTPQAKFLVTVLDSTGENQRLEERRAWSVRSKLAMSRVFGNDEPEYSAAAIP